MKTIIYFLLSPAFFVLCLLQAVCVAFVFAVIAQPFGGARIFVVSYRRRDEHE